MVEHSTVDQVVPGSNPGVSLFFVVLQGRVVHGATLRNFCPRFPKRPSAYQYLIYLRTFSKDYFDFFAFLEKAPHFSDDR